MLRYICKARCGWSPQLPPKSFLELGAARLQLQSSDTLQSSTATRYLQYLPLRHPADRVQVPLLHHLEWTRRILHRPSQDATGRSNPAAQIAWNPPKANQNLQRIVEIEFQASTGNGQ